MNRLCIYVVYDKQNKINQYIGNVLKEIKKHVSDIIVVCNFNKISYGEEYIRPYVREVYFRKNIGFDAGAYKDTIIDFISWDRILLYDELLLTNDTYFAPIYPFDTMFNKMESEKCDFWGITKHPKVFLEGIGEFSEHIQSYFLFLKKQVLHSDFFKEFWNEYKYPTDKIYAIVSFEIGINTFLTQHGFVGKSYIDSYNFEFMNQDSVNPYIRYVLELIRDAKVPIIKKTNFYGKNRWLLQNIKAMQYIEENTPCDTRGIYNYIEEYQKKGLLGTYYDYELMRLFVEKFSDIYVYGHGNWGQITEDYFKYKGWKIKAFLVTEEKKDSDDIIFSSVTINSNAGIIIAQEYKSTCDEIIEIIGDKCSKEQIFTPCYFN